MSTELPTFDRAKHEIERRIKDASDRQEAAHQAMQLAESDRYEAEYELADLTTWAAATPEDRAAVLAMADRLAVGRQAGECRHEAQSRVVAFDWAESAGLLGDSFDLAWGEQTVSPLGELAVIIAFRGVEWAERVAA